MMGILGGQSGIWEALATLSEGQRNGDQRAVEPTTSFSVHIFCYPEGKVTFLQYIPRTI
jgi:hypothetical protein